MRKGRKKDKYLPENSSKAACSEVKNQQRVKKLKSQSIFDTIAAGKQCVKKIRSQRSAASHKKETGLDLEALLRCLFQGALLRCLF